jgi:hypothetical protein
MSHYKICFKKHKLCAITYQPDKVHYLTKHICDPVISFMMEDFVR